MFTAGAEYHAMSAMLIFIFEKVFLLFISEVEFHVVDLESMAASGISSVKYEGKSNLFSVPAETLKNNDIGKITQVFSS